MLVSEEEDKYRHKMKAFSLIKKLRSCNIYKLIIFLYCIENNIDIVYVLIGLRLHVLYLKYACSFQNTCIPEHENCIFLK